MGPDAARYLFAAEGVPVPRPFHLRVLLPWLCGTDPRRWWVAWSSGWVLAAVGMFLLATSSPGTPWQVGLATTALLLGLSGFLGPSVTIPIGVDIPATGLALVGASLYAYDLWWLGLPVVAVSALIRETTPVWSALWLWSPLPLVALAVPLVVNWLRPTGPDPLGLKFQQIADHPVRSALEHHAGRWRDGWLMVAPWGVTLAALIAPSWPLVVALVFAYGQLLIATDTVRLLHHAAGPVMALGAAQVIPVEWLLLAVVVHVVWWRKPERV